MSLVILFGINGVGKDTIAKRAAESVGSIDIISGSRVMMKGLGFDVGITSDSPVTDEMYRALELTPSDVKANMADTIFRQELISYKQANPDRIGVISSHLVIARREGNSVSFETDLIRDWFPQTFDLLVHVTAPVDDIIERHARDSFFRDRGFHTEESLRKMATYDSLLWGELCQQVDPAKVLEIKNSEGELDNASELFKQKVLSIKSEKYIPPVK